MIMQVESDKNMFEIGRFVATFDQEDNVTNNNW